MKKLKLLMVTCALFMGCMVSNAKVTIDTDLTSQFPVDFAGWSGATGFVGWAAPEVTTNDGRKTPACERYQGDWNGGCTTLGDVFTRTLTGLANGTYRIELYGAAAFTPNRNMESTLEEGDNSCVYLYAETASGIVKQYIPAHVADNFNGTGIATAVLEGVEITDGTVKLGMYKDQPKTNWHVIQIKGVTATVDAEEVFAKYKSEAEELYESPMNATVLNNLKTAANVDLSAAGANEYKTAIEELAAVIVTAKASVANYADAKTFIDYISNTANTFDKTGQESFNSNESVLAIKTAYDDGTLDALTAEQKAAANEALAIACKAQVQPADGSYMTPYIVNASFENQLDGWTNNGMQAQNNTSFEKEGVYYCEAWQPNGTKSVSQLVTLPIGYYSLSVKSKARGVTSAKLYAGENATEMTIADATNVYTVEFVCSGNTTIGFEGVGTGAGSSWLCVDDFQLTYLRQLTTEEEEEIAKPGAIEAYNNALLAAQAVTDIPTTAYNALQEVINANTLSDGTLAQYNNATAALNEAKANAEVLVSPYAAWKELKAQADALVAVANDNADANSTLATAISDQNTAAEAATTADALTTATSTLKTAMVTYANVTNPAANAQFDLTFMLTNPDLTNVEGWKPAAGWYNDQTQPTQNSQVMNTNQAVANTADKSKYAFYEYWSNSTEPTEGYVVYQKVTLPEGTYKMTALAFAGFGGGHRYGYQTDGDHSLGSLGEGEPNITFSAGDIDGTHITTTTLEDASIDFVQEAEGEVKIGLKAHKDNRSNWMGIGYVKLFKAHAVTVDIDEAVDYTPESVAGKVTLKRTLSTEKWNTFVVPFQISNEELKEAFGDDVQVAEFKDEPITKTVGEGDDAHEENTANSNIIFTVMETPAVSAQVPVLLKPGKVAANNEYVFANRTVAAGEAKVAGTNFDFVGTYAASTTVAEGDYFIGENKLWRSTGATTIKGTRAYIKTKTAGATARLVINGEETTGIETVAAKQTNEKIYNLNGQVVNRAQKGIFIMNGKKVVK